MAGADLVVYTRTAASDFRLFLNIAPESLHWDREVFEAVSDLVDRAFDAEGGIHVAIVRGDVCICGLAGQPSGIDPDMSYIGGRRNIAFVGLCFDGPDTAILPSDVVMWELYEKHVRPIWDIPASKVGGPLQVNVEVPESARVYPGWNPEPLSGSVARSIDHVEIIEFDRMRISDERSTHMEHQPESNPEHVHGVKRPGGGILPAGSVFGSSHSDTLDAYTPSSGWERTVAERTVESVFGKDLSDACRTAEGERRPDFVSSDGRVEIEVSMDLMDRSGNRSQQIRYGLMSGFRLRRIIGRSFERMAPACEPGVGVGSMPRAAHTLKLVLYPVDVDAYDSVHMRELGKILKEFDFDRFGIDGVVIKAIPVTTEDRDVRCRVYFQDEQRMDRRRFESPGTEFIEVSTPRKRSTER